MQTRAKNLEELTRISRPRRFWGALLTCALVSELMPTQAMVRAFAAEGASEPAVAVATAGVAEVGGVALPTLADAFSIAATSQDHMVTLISDVELLEPVVVAGEVVLDVAGHTVDVVAPDASFEVGSGASLVVKDSATTDAPSYDAATGQVSYRAGKIARATSPDDPEIIAQPLVRVRDDGAFVLLSGSLEAASGTAIDAASDSSVSLEGGAVVARGDAVLAGEGSTISVTGAIVLRSQEGVAVSGAGELELGAGIIAEGEGCLFGSGRGEEVPRDEASGGERAAGNDEVTADADTAGEVLPAEEASKEGVDPSADMTAGPIDLAAEDLALSVTVRGGTEFAYTGSPIVPEVESVTATLPGGETRELVLGRDFELGADPAFTNNTDVTAEGATLTVVGKGAYTGVATVTGVFAITPIDLAAIDASQVSLSRDEFEYGTVPANLDVRIALGDVELASGEGGALSVTKLTPDADAHAGGSYAITVTPAPGNGNLIGSLTVEDAYGVTARNFTLAEVYCLPTDDVSYDYDSDALKHVFDGLCVQFDGEDEPALSYADGSLSLAFFDVTNEDAKPQRLAASPSVPGDYRLVITSRNQSYTTEPAAGIALAFSIEPTEYDRFDVPMVAETNLVYNGRRQHVELAKGTVWGYGWHPLASGVFGSAVEATDAGTYSFTAALNDPISTRWRDGSHTNKVVNWTIDALDIANKPVELCADSEGNPLSFVAGEAAKATYVKVGDDLIDASNFDIVYPEVDGTTVGKAGQVRALVQGKAARGNVVGSALATFEIAKASLAGATLTLGEVAEGQLTRESQLVLADGTEVDPDEYVVLYHRVGAADGDETATVPTASGTYELRVALRAHGNYDDAELVVLADGSGNAIDTLSVA